ncbi:hypothetical protein BV898_03675 [Hypsibius exemplaris]|uniref:Insulin-like domain-containing protein n=1 Tax=Hypsibius exemplaris TaxID=2072580 RepID=A0A1W0X589_HYPEX|nr:hypothetical protein BV898_03675 [Hypsibius exemplaris]
MSIYGLQRFVSLCLLSLMCCITPLLTAPAGSAPGEARRNICGTGLAEVLKMLCKGKYQSPQKNKDAGDIDQEVTSVTQECCSKACSLPQLANYCAVKPDMMEDFECHVRNESAHMSPSRGSASSGSGDSGSSLRGSGGGGGRLADLGRLNLYEASLLERRLDDYEAIPFRQRRKR